MNSLMADPWDIVTIGETMLRLTPQGFHRLEQSDAFQVHVGGSESNTAVGLARLGKKVAWLSRLTDNHLGRRIERAIAAHGVDTNHVLWTQQDRVGLYFLEAGSPPRQSQVIYDRANSAFSKITPSEIPSALFVPGRSRWLHVTGISLWVSSHARESIAHAISLARSAGWKISFDVNHRALMCTPAEARSYCQSIVETADLVFVPRRDAIHLWQLETSQSDEQILKSMVEIRSGKPTVMTLNNRGAMAADGSELVFQPIEPVEPIGRLGGGDAFSAGYLSAWLDGNDLAEALRWATATARLKYSIPGDLPLIDRAEVERLVAGGTGESLRR